MSARRDVTAAFRLQAEKCREMGSPFTGALLARAAAALEGDGPLPRLIGHWPGDAIEDALPLRLAGALHALVLEGQDAALAAAYPDRARAGDAERAWRAAEARIAAAPEDLACRLQSPPQTNETGRALGLFPGLLTIAGGSGLPLDLCELGASAGLNLHMDAFAYRTGAWSWGEGPVVIEGEWRGSPPPLEARLRVAGRSGCDRNPLDPGTPEHRRRLRSYVWADQRARLARLDAALDLAAGRQVRVERADAAAWLERRLGERRREALTVIYHSVFWQYPQAETRAAMEAAIRRAGETATADAPLAWLRFEPEAIMGGSRGAGRYFVDLTLWPGGARRVLAEVDPHGRWVDWRG